MVIRIVLYTGRVHSNIRGYFYMFMCFRYMNEIRINTKIPRLDYKKTQDLLQLLLAVKLLEAERMEDSFL